MRETTKQNLAILFITLFLGGSLYLFVSYINPLIVRSKKLKKEIEEEKLKIIKIEEYRKKSEELIKTYLNLGEEVKKIDLALPKDPQSAQIIAVLDKIFKDNSITINNISFSEGSKNEYKYLEVKLSFIATYEGFKNISQEIEKELRLLDIDKVSIKNISSQMAVITPAPKSKKKTKITTPPSPYLEFNISILSYYLSKEGVIKSQTEASF
ncbi:MAG: type 4a pilus biogenesis protein PilO [Minisyncoccia bacterium]